MKLMTIFISLHLISLCVYISASIDQELRKSVEIAMECKYREPPTLPVIAISPTRFTQIVVILHERFNTNYCFKTSKSPITVSDVSTWPFCVFGRCNQGKCQCANHFSGRKCGQYTKKCWLMYCFLTSCHPAHQSLHCICDPKLYGTKTTTGIYWYDEGKRSKYEPPPRGWQDQPSGMIKVKSDSDIEIANPNPNLNQNIGSRSTTQNTARDSNIHNSGRKKGLYSLTRLTSFSNERPVGPPPYLPPGSQSLPFESQNARLQGQNKSPFPKGNGGNVAGDARESLAEEKKSDVEEALDELEEVSAAVMLSSCNLYMLMLVILTVHLLHRSI